MSSAGDNTYQQMKKIIYKQFGNADVLQMAEFANPLVTETTILIKVKAVSINPLDWKIMNGEMKLMAGSKFPRGTGIDFSGIIEEVGNSIEKYKKGDEVFGLLDVFKGAALSEYILVNERDISLKPRGISFEEAAAAPVVGSAALQIINTLVDIHNGSEVLINGASGGIGMFAIQIAKMKGAMVTAVVSNSALRAVKDWGATYAVDYQAVDVLKENKHYDVVIDLSNQMSFSAAKRIMKASSVYVHTAPGPKEIISSFFVNLISGKKFKVLMLKPAPAYLTELTTYIEQGLAIAISNTYPLTSFREAYMEVKHGHIIGKAVIVVG